MQEQPRDPAQLPAGAGDSRRAAALLAIGAAVGIALAMAGALNPTHEARAVPAGALAVVNGHVIRSEDLERALAQLSQDSQRVLTETDHRRLVDRLIDEQVLVDRAVELGMLDTDRSVRKAIVQAMIEQIVLEASAKAPSEAELRSYYDRNRERLVPAATTRVRRAVFRRTLDGADPGARARRAADAVAGGVPFDRVASDMADAPEIEIPDALLPPTKLREYLGASAVNALAQLAPGQVTAPLASEDGFEILELVERRSADPPSFESARPVVAALVERDAADIALRDYLDDLRARAQIRLARGVELP